MNPLTDLILTSQIRGLLLLLVAWGLATLLRRHSPAYECIVWRGAFAGLLAIPLLTSLAPPVTLPHNTALASTDFLATLQTRTEQYRVQFLDGPLSPVAEDAKSSDASSHESHLLPVAEDAKSSESSTINSRLPSQHPTAPTTIVGEAPRLPSQHPSPPTLPWTNVLLSLWILGTSAMLLRLATAFTLRAHMLRRTLPLENDLTRRTLETLRHELGIRPTVQLRLHSGLPSPLSWGISRPTILLPAGAEHWDEPTLRLVLSHELNHFSSHDAIYRLVSEFTLIAYWINPLVWIALRRARLSEEKAIDIAVLSRGEDPASYAGLLLNFARQAGRHTNPAAQLAIPMAQPSTVVARLEAVLRPGQKFQHPPRPHRLLCAAAITLIALLTGGLAFQAQPSTEDSKTGNHPLLFTKAYKISPAIFRQGGMTAPDLLWGSRGVEPPQGASALYNPTANQLVIRATENDFAYFEETFVDKWHEQLAIAQSCSDIEVLLFELRTSDANRLASEFGDTVDTVDAVDAAGALAAIRRLAANEPSTVRLLGTINLSPTMGRSQAASFGTSVDRIRWNDFFSVIIELRSKKNENLFEIGLRVGLDSHDAPPSRKLSTVTDLQAGLSRLAGFIDSTDGSTRTAVFMTLRGN